LLVVNVWVSAIMCRTEKLNSRFRARDQAPLPGQFPVSPEFTAEIRCEWVRLIVLGSRSPFLQRPSECRKPPLVPTQSVFVVGTFPPPNNQLRESAFSNEVTGIRIVGGEERHGIDIKNSLRRAKHAENASSAVSTTRSKTLLQISPGFQDNYLIMHDFLV